MWSSVFLILIALLILFVIFPFPSPRPKVSAEHAAKIEMEMLIEALRAFHNDTKRYPTTSEGLRALTNDPGVSGWQGPYINHKKFKEEKTLTDPWGRAFVYEYPGKHGDYDLYSYGKDGNPGGTGDDQDITSWEKRP